MMDKARLVALGVIAQADEGSPDVTAPTVVSVTPLDEATNVSADTEIVITFSEAMDPEQMNSDNLALLNDADDPVPLSIVMSEGDTVATLTPDDPLESSGVYRVSIRGLDDGGTTADAAGNVLPETLLQATGFTVADTIAPTVVSTSPADGATDVAVDAPLSITFSEAMDQEVTGSDSVIGMLSDGIPVVMAGATFTWDESGSVVTIMGLALDAHETSYKFTVSTDATDAAGNHLAEAYESLVGFTTVSE